MRSLVPMERKIQPAGECRRGQGGRRYFDRATYWHARVEGQPLALKFSTDLLDEHEGRIQLPDVGQHGDHQTHRAERGGT